MTSLIKKAALFSVLNLAVIASSQAELAGSVDMNFTGNIRAGSCQVDAKDGQVVIDLGTIPLDKLLTAPYAGDWKAFSITFSKCSSDLTTSEILFNGTAAGDASQYYANAGDAQNVFLELVTAETGENLGPGKKTNVAINTDGSGQYDLKVRAISPAHNATTGEITGTITAQVSYR